MKSYCPRLKIMYFVIFFFGFCGLAKNSHAATINAASCSYADVSAAIQNASAGDTVNVPAGTCAWNNRLEISKAITLIGAGAANTIINNGYSASCSGVDPTVYLLSILPTCSSNPAIRISGFTFNFGTASCGILYKNYSSTTECTKVRLDQLNISAAGFVFVHYGLAHGVMDNSIIRGTMDMGGSEVLWAANNAVAAYEYGNNSNFYFEDNTWSYYSDVVDFGHAGNGAVRYAFRYNTIISPPGHQESPLFDEHGNQPAQTGCFGAEIYGNSIDATNNENNQMNLYAQRGGKSLFYFNSVTYPVGKGAVKT